MSQTKKEKGVIVPHHELSAAALQGLLEEFVSRDGTDSGYTKLSLQQRVDQVRRQLDRGEAVVVYNPVAQSANIIPRSNIYDPKGGRYNPGEGPDGGPPDGPDDSGDSCGSGSSGGCFIRCIK